MTPTLRFSFMLAVSFAAFLGAFASTLWGASLASLFKSGEPQVPEYSAEEWASRVVKADASYILYFRHAEREKWPLVVTYDWLEISSGIDPRTVEWAEGVCLSERGILDAALARVVVEEIGLPVGKVLSSPSCRARETAGLVFGRIDDVDISILHPTAVVGSKQEEFAENLRSLLLRSGPEKGSVTVVVGHGATLEPYYSQLFGVARDTASRVNLDLDELGFAIIELTDDSLQPRYAFKSFSDFANNVLQY